MLIQDCAPFWHELWHPAQAVHVALTRGLKNILFLHHVSNIFQELFDLQGNMHVNGCPETYSRIRCHVLPRLLVYVRMMLLCAKKKKTPTDVCLLRSHCSFSYLCHRVFWGFHIWMMLCPICRVLMSDILIHLKGCAKTVPLHTTLPANPRYWLGADSKATPVGLCTSQSQVTDPESDEKKQNKTKKKNNRPRATNATHSHSYIRVV